MAAGCVGMPRVHGDGTSTQATAGLGCARCIGRSVGAHSALAITRDAAAPIHWTIVSIAAARVLVNTNAG